MLEPIIDDVDDIEILVNPTGEFLIGGPYADSGLTGRKIIVDNYGGYAKHVGGAFSGKDVSKVDRSGAYYAKYVAKAVVRANLADRCEVQLGYVIGISNPASIHINTFNIGVISDEAIQELVSKIFDFRPSMIRKELFLDEVKYQDLAKYGHCGREDLNVALESVELKAKELRELYEETKKTSQVL